MNKIKLDTTYSTAFFGSWSSYQVPLVPANPISENEIHNRTSYYKALYNEYEQLTSFEKYFDGKKIWRDDYTYWPNGKLKKRIMFKEGPTGQTATMQEFNQEGHLIKDALDEDAEAYAEIAVSVDAEAGA